MTFCFTVRQGNKRVALKNHAAVRPRSGHGLAVQEHFAARGLIESGHNADEGRLSATGRSDDGDELPPVDVERNIVENDVLMACGTEGLLETCARRAPPDVPGCA